MSKYEKKSEVIPLVKTSLPPREVLIPEIEKVLYSGYIAQGPKVDEFEQGFAKYIGSGDSLALNSGTAALHIALILAGVSDGDEVISTALTAEPTNVAIKMVGAKIRYADIDPNTGCISPVSIAENINSRTKAIMVVDYAGVPINVPEIEKISKTYGIPVIHDAAHALGASFNGKKTGHHFRYTVFSFQAIKHLTTIDGGVLHLQIENEYKKGKLIRWFGLDKGSSRFDNDIILQGYKYHMNDVNASIGLVQLDFIESIISKHISNGKYFDQELRGVPGIELLEYYSGSKPSYWLYTMKVEDRDGFKRKLKDAGVMASELHKRNDSHTYLNDFNQKLPNLDRFYEQMVHIPCGWWVEGEDRQRILETIKSGW